MRAQHELMHSRARVKACYALLPLEGYPLSRLPAWPQAEVRVLVAPVMGAAFVEYLIDLPKSKGGTQAADGRNEVFVYVLEGKLAIAIDGKKHVLNPGGFTLVPPTSSFTARAQSKTRLLMLRKPYEPAPGIALFKPLVCNAASVKATSFCGDPGAKLQLLIPDDFQYDIAMNVFEFEVGHSLPYVETHVMEHGLYFMQGKGLYYLDDTWMEVEASDFIWMGPYVPQCFYATGPVSSKYIYYKNVNRDIPL